MDTQKRPHTGRGDRRAEILRALRAETTATAAELAEALGIHPNTVRFHLGVLESNGDVIREQVPARRPGRPELRFRIVARPSAAGPDLLARILLERVASAADPDRKSTRLNSSHVASSYAGFCLRQKQHAGYTSRHA